MRERWLGATGVRVPEIAVEGELELPDGVLWLDEAAPEELRAAHAEGRPVVARASGVGVPAWTTASCALLPSAIFRV